MPSDTGLPPLGDPPAWLGPFVWLTVFAIFGLVVTLGRLLIRFVF